MSSHDEIVMVTSMVNDGAAARDGQITVNGSLVQVSQKAPCRYVLTPPTMNMGVGGGGGQIAVATASECAWTASGDGEWITVAPPATGTGNGTVNFTIANNTGSDRTGSIVVAGQLAHRAGVHDLAVVHHRNRVAERARHVEVLLDRTVGVTRTVRSGRKAKTNNTPGPTFLRLLHHRFRDQQP